MLGKPSAVVAAGVYDGMSALLAQQAGFSLLYLSGAALTGSKALPDLGLLTLEDVTRAARDITRAANLPLIVDCDTGFGEALNVMRTVRELEETGVACMQIEDQQIPKKCGHLNDKRLLDVDHMCRKIAAARKAAEHLVICARTDAAAESIDDAIHRAKCYVDAGAELIFVEALTDRETIRRIRSEISAPLLANMTEFGRTPSISVSEWEQHGYNVVIFPVSAFRVASRYLKHFYASLMSNGHVGEFLPEMMTRAELYDTIRYYDYEALDASIAKSVLNTDAPEPQ
jgi:methylisocitrate lyase